MDTLTPTVYQYYGTNITSKGAMEPFAIINGIGPVRGFNKIDISKGYVTITHSESNILGATRTSYLADTSNEASIVHNAYISPSGLLRNALDSLAFTTSTITSIPSGSSAKLYVLSAKHTYSASATETDVSTLSDFTLRDMTLPEGFLTEVFTDGVDIEELISILEDYLDITWDYGKEILIGVYVVGTDLVGEGNYITSLISGTEGLTSLVPYGYQWPPLYSSTIPQIYKDRYDNTGAYDVVIRTQDEFETLISSSTWFGVKSVAFVGNGGDLKFTRSDGSGVFVPNNVTRIEGYANATISVANFVYNNATNPGAVWRNAAAADSITISELMIECNSTTTTSNGFVNCNKLTNCTSNCTSTSTSTTSIYTYGFVNCDYLTNCIAITSTSVTTQTSSSVHYSYGFNNCDYLTNCTSTPTCTCISGYAYANGFVNCNKLTNCTSNCTSTSTPIYGFNGCTKVSYCTSPQGFNNCYAGGSGDGEIDTTASAATGWNYTE